MSGLVTMSDKELTRQKAMQQIEEKRLNQREAAKKLKISERHVNRILRSYRQSGVAGLVSKRRGKPSNNQLKGEVKQQVIDLIYSQYHDFGPTLAHEKLTEKHSVKLSVETVRKLMIKEGLWKPKKTKRLIVHQMRERRACLGELVQLDGSPHPWFEERGEACILLVYIDDATGRLMELYFTPGETTFSYFAATERYLARFGKPVAFYSDKNSIFKVNIKNALTGSGMTQFGRAMKELDIEIICANTPQAKGRVERANQILQDRLVKEMRLRGISSIEAANEYAAEFMTDYNARFSVQPRSSQDAHRSLGTKEDLERVFTLQEQRNLSKNLTLQYKNVVYQIQTSRPSYAMRKASVTVCENNQGKIEILYKGQPLEYTIYQEQQRQAEVVSSKDIHNKLKKPYKPGKNHPWRRYGQFERSKPISKVAQNEPAPSSD
ncbi:MAG: ISNCY family transposase [Anaerolineales bacterium]